MSCSIKTGIFSALGFLTYSKKFVSLCVDGSRLLAGVTVFAITLSIAATRAVELLRSAPLQLQI